jgi:hypothetical protein
MGNYLHEREGRVAARANLTEQSNFIGTEIFHGISN